MIEKIVVSLFSWIDITLYPILPQECIPNTLLKQIFKKKKTQWALHFTSIHLFHPINLGIHPLDVHRVHNGQLIWLMDRLMISYFISMMKINKSINDHWID